MGVPRHWGIAMHSNRRARAAARRENHYQASWIAALLALAAAMLLAWHGLARADGFEAPPTENSQSDQPSTPPAVLPCTDQMDFSPDDNLPDAFDAVDVAWHPARVPLFPLLRVTLDGGCGDLNSPTQI
jgi:hypothetical protein